MSDILEIPMEYIGTGDYFLFVDNFGDLYICDRTTRIVGDKDNVVAMVSPGMVRFDKWKDIEKSIPECTILGVATHKIQPV